MSACWLVCVRACGANYFRFWAEMKLDAHERSFELKYPSAPSDCGPRRASPSPLYVLACPVKREKPDSTCMNAGSSDFREDSYSGDDRMPKKEHCSPVPKRLKPVSSTCWKTGGVRRGPRGGRG